MNFTGKNLRVIEDSLWRYITQKSVMTEEKEIAQKMLNKIEKNGTKKIQ